jgi:glycosyltransferase involved in cell wall biosynthesis
MPLTHVAVLVAGSHLGGAERSLLSLIRRAASEMRFTLLMPEAGELADHAERSGAAVSVTPWSPRLLALGERSGGPSPAVLAGAVPAVWQAARAVRQRVEAVRADVLVTNGIKPHMIGALASSGRPDLPLIWYLRESTEGRRLSRRLLSLAARRCDAAIAISKYVAADAAHYLPAKASVDVAYNIIDAPFAAAGSEGQEPSLTKGTGECWFATVGALTALKGQDVFLRAAAIASRELPGARFLVVGANRYATEQHTGYEAELRRLVTELGLGDRVTFMGHRRDVPALLSRVDVLVQSNTAPEGFGRSVAEAMRAGVPVIASRAWSFLELIEDRRTGWLVPPGDSAALAQRMISAAREPDERHAVAARAREAIGEITQAERSLATFRQVVVQAIEKRTRPTAGVRTMMSGRG